MTQERTKPSRNQQAHSYTPAYTHADAEQHLQKLKDERREGLKSDLCGVVIMSTRRQEKPMPLDWTTAHCPSTCSLLVRTSSFRMAPVTENIHSEKLLPSKAVRCQVRAIFLISMALSKISFTARSESWWLFLNPSEVEKSQSLSKWYGNTFLHCHVPYADSMCWCKTYHCLKENTTFPSQRANHIIYWLSCSYNIFSISPACTANLSLPYVKSVYHHLNSDCSFSHRARSRRASAPSHTTPATLKLMLIPDNRWKTSAVTRTISHATTGNTDACWKLPIVSTLIDLLASS